MCGSGQKSGDLGRGLGEPVGDPPGNILTGMLLTCLWRDVKILQAVHLRFMCFTVYKYLNIDVNKTEAFICLVPEV